MKRRDISGVLHRSWTRRLEEIERRHHGVQEIRPELLTVNPFKLIGADLMLITAGTSESFNTILL